MRFYLLFTLLALYLSTYSQIHTQIDSLGYKFSINLPEGSEFNFSDTYYSQEVKDPVHKTNFQIILKLENHDIYVTMQKADNFDIERAKKGWLKDSNTKIAEETKYSLVFCTNGNKNEEYHILYHKTLSEGTYTFSVFYQSLTYQEVKKVTQILDTAK